MVEKIFNNIVSDIIIVFVATACGFKENAIGSIKNGVVQNCIVRINTCLR